VEACTEIGRKGVKTLPEWCDVTKREEVEAVVQKSVQEMEKINILVNNAGVAGSERPILKMSDAESAKLGLPEEKIGILPGTEGTQRIPQLMGKGLAAEIVLIGEPIDAQEAYRVSLVNRAVPDGQVVAVAEKMARKILENASIAVELAKDVMEVEKVLSLPGAIQYAQENCITCFVTEDMKEGTAAFLQKRKPQFKGR